MATLKTEDFKNALGKTALFLRFSISKLFLHLRSPFWESCTVIPFGFSTS